MFRASCFAVCVFTGVLDAAYTMSDGRKQLQDFCKHFTSVDEAARGLQAYLHAGTHGAFMHDCWLVDAV